MQTKKTQPFLRWAGGKNWLVPTVAILIEGLSFGNYHEPFLGGGSVFFSIETNKKSYLSDLNAELIETYSAVRDCPERVIEIMQGMNSSEEAYYKIRSWSPTDICEKAARFIFLNQTSFNGIYRVNLKGEYNVPYGFRDFNYDYNRIVSASKKLKKTLLRNGDFGKTKNKIKSGDLVFLDPPYTVSHNHNGFIEYNQKIFSFEDQIRLSKFIDEISSRGAFYILTNAAHEAIIDIFNHDCTMLEVSRSSVIGGKNAKRKKVSELVFTNIPNAKEKMKP